MQKRQGIAGNIILMLFGAIAVAGALGTGYVATMKGPGQTLSQSSRANSAENQMLAAVKLVLPRDSAQQDCDADGTIEPMPFRTGAGPTGGGLVPLESGSVKNDPWGNQLGYCVWDHGKKTKSDDIAGCGGSSANRLNGGNIATEVVMAIVSAGKDGIFQTTCNAWVDTNDDKIADTPLIVTGGDDIVRRDTIETLLASGALAQLPNLPDSACVAGAEGTMRFENGVPQVCTSTGWKEIGANSGSANDFVNVVDVETDTETTSNQITMSGFFGTRKIVVNNGARIIVNGVDRGSSTDVAAGDLVAIMATSASTPNTLTSYVLKVGSVSKGWSITSGGASCTLDGQVVAHNASHTFYSSAVHASCGTVGQSRTCTNGTLSGTAPYQYATCVVPDNTPNSFTFTNVTDIPVSTTVASNIVQITGIAGNVSTSISGSGASYRICSDASCSSVVTNWTTGSTSIVNNRYLQLRMTSSSTGYATLSTTMTVGTVSAGWSVTAACNPSQWVARESNRLWYATASSETGEHLAAVVNGGPIYISNDWGQTWTARATNRNWRRIAMSADGSIILAAVSSTPSNTNGTGQLYVSTDGGLNWTARESNRKWRGVAMSDDGTRMVANVQDGQIYTSTNTGTSWTARDSNRAWQHVASSADGMKLVAGVAGGQLYTSTNAGVSWTSRESSRGWLGTASSNDGNILMAVTSGILYVSTNSGATWTGRANSTTSAYEPGAISGDGSVMIVANGASDGSSSYSTPISVTTNGGSTWTTEESSRNWVGNLSMSDDGTHMFGSALNGQLYVKGCPAPSGPPTSCTLDGQTILNGNSHTFYSASTHPTSCSSVSSQTRTCTNGVLSGSGTYAYASCNVPVDNLTLVGQTTGTSNSISWPAGIQAGDLAVLYNYVRQSNGGTAVTPAGFNNIRNSGYDSDAEAGSTTSWKILDGSEGSAITGSIGSSATRWIMAVFRPNTPIQSVTATFVGQTTNWQNPGVITYSIAGTEGPLLLLSSSGSTGSISGKTSSPAQTALTTSAASFQASYYLYNKGQTAVNHTYDSGDSGDANINQCSYLTIR